MVPFAEASAELHGALADLGEAITDEFKLTAVSISRLLLGLVVPRRAVWAGPLRHPIGHRSWRPERRVEMLDYWLPPWLKGRVIRQEWNADYTERRIFDARPVEGP